MGSILTDAMQFGLPIVATLAGGIPDVVRDGETRILVPIDDHQALGLGHRPIVFRSHLARHDLILLLVPRYAVVRL